MFDYQRTTVREFMPSKLASKRSIGNIQRRISFELSNEVSQSSIGGCLGFRRNREQLPGLWFSRERRAWRLFKDQMGVRSPNTE